MNCASNVGSFTPGADSTPEDTSATSGARRRTIPATLPGRSPPATTTRTPGTLRRNAARGSTNAFQSRGTPDPPSCPGTSASKTSTPAAAATSRASGGSTPPARRTTGHGSASPVARNQASARQRQLAEDRARNYAYRTGEFNKRSTRYIAVRTEEGGRAQGKAQVMIYDIHSGTIVENTVYDMQSVPPVGEMGDFGGYRARYIGTGA